MSTHNYISNAGLHYIQTFFQLIVHFNRCFESVCISVYFSKAGTLYWPFTKYRKLPRCCTHNCGSNGANQTHAL